MQNHKMKALFRYFSISIKDLHGGGGLSTMIRIVLYISHLLKSKTGEPLYGNV